MNVYLGELYKEVEYIQSSGTQCIDTGYIPSNNTKIEMSMGGFNGSTSANTLFGARYSWTPDASIGRGFQWSVNVLTSPYDYGGMFGRKYTGGTGIDNFNQFNWGNGGNYILSLDQSGFYQDGVKKYTPNTVTFTSPVNLYIFANNTNGQISEFAPYKLYYFKIYTSGTLVRDFIPCYRVSDNVIGLFDKVENKFYTNAGTGTFTKGNDVGTFQPELKNAYIGEVINISSDLRGATLAGLQAQGWDNIYCVVQGGGSGNYTLDSNGLSIHGTTNLYAILYKNIPDLSDTATVDLHITGYTTRVSSGYSYEYNTWVGCGLSPVASEYYNGIYGGYLSGNTNTPHGYTGITYKRGLLGNTSYTNVAGNFDITIKINLASGLVNYQITSPVSLTSNYTLNSTQLSDVRSMKYINIPLRLYVGDNTLRLYTVELTVS